MVMGDDSSPEGREFEIPAEQSILAGHFSHIFVVKIVRVENK